MLDGQTVYVEDSSVTQLSSNHMLRNAGVNRRPEKSGSRKSKQAERERKKVAALL
jgi:hypothetical protein